MSYKTAWVISLVLNFILIFAGVSISRYSENKIDKLQILATEQTAQITQLTAERERCGLQLQASAARQLELQAAVREYEAQIQQGQIPGGLLAVLAKLLL